VRSVLLALPAVLLAVGGAMHLSAFRKASAAVAALLSLIPLSTAALLYFLIGNFFAAHVLVMAGASMAAAALR